MPESRHRVVDVAGEVEGVFDGGRRGGDGWPGAGAGVTAGGWLGEQGVVAADGLEEADGDHVRDDR